MFSQFLHPQLVIFGNFLKDNIKIDLPISMVDFNLVIQQTINRQNNNKKPLFYNKKKHHSYQNINKFDIKQYEKDLFKQKYSKNIDYQDQWQDDLQQNNQQQMNMFQQLQDNVNDKFNYYETHGQLNQKQILQVQRLLNKYNIKKKDELKPHLEQDQQQDEGWQTEQQQQRYIQQNKYQNDIQYPGGLN